MDTIRDFEGKVKRAEWLLEKSDVYGVNKELIPWFVVFKTAEKVKLPRFSVVSAKRL